MNFDYTKLPIKSRKILQPRSNQLAFYFFGFVAIILATFFTLSFKVSVFIGALIILLLVYILINRWLKVQWDAESNEIQLFADANNWSLGSDNLNNLPSILKNYGSNPKILYEYTIANVNMNVYELTMNVGYKSEQWKYFTIVTFVPSKMYADFLVLNRSFETPFTANKEKYTLIDLEGDFRQYFTFYAAKNVPQQALEIMTPDLMRDFIDHAIQYSVEVSGGTVYVVARGKCYDQTNLPRLLNWADMLSKAMSK